MKNGVGRSTFEVRRATFDVRGLRRVEFHRTSKIWLRARDSGKVAAFLPGIKGAKVRHAGIKEEGVKKETRSQNDASLLLVPITVLVLSLVACTGPKPLPDLSATGSQPPAVSSDTRPSPSSLAPETPPAELAPQVILVSDPGSPAGLTPPSGVPAEPAEIAATGASAEQISGSGEATAGGAGEVLTPEAAQILKEHGYDPGGLLRDPAGTLQTAQLLRETDVDPFAAKDGADAGEIEEYDPWEKVNVLTFEFNYKLDKYLVKPVAKGYNFIMPDLAQRGVANFFQNIRFVPRLLNNVFQAKFLGAGIEGSRFLLNTTLGVAGLFDPAKAWFKLETPVEDTGQTFGWWGFKPGPYLVVPLLGSFTVRDGLGYIADLALDPFNWFVLPIIKLSGVPKVVSHDDTILFAQLGMRAGIIVNDRSLNLEKFQGVEESTLDLYTAVRNAYLQSRAKLIRE